MFSTIETATTGTLKVNISGAPANLAKVKVSGPNGYASGNLGSSATLNDLEPGAYTITAQGFGTGQLGKPTCKSYIPTVPSQTATVTAGQTLSTSVTYEVESCSIDEP